MGRPSTAESLKEYFSTGVNKARWEKAKTAASARGTFGEYDDGKYLVKVVTAKVNRSEASGRLQHVLGFKFMEGEYKGQKVYQYQGLENDVGIEILIATMKKLGFEIEDPEDIETTADHKLEKSQPEVMIRIKTNGEYQNVIVLGEAKEKTADESEEEDESDDTEADEPEERTEKTEETDEDDDEEGEEKASKEADEDDEDEEDEEEEEIKPSKKAKKTAPKEADEDDEDEEETKEEVNLELGMKIKVQHKGEEKKAKIVSINEDDNKVKVKFLDGTKEWIRADAIVDVA